MTYTEDRETFERDIFKPPHIARMLDVCGEFTGRLGKQDREFFLTAAMQLFWDYRALIKTQNDIYRLWVTVLDDVAHMRSRWEVNVSHWGVVVRTEWLKSSRLRRVP